MQLALASIVSRLEGIREEIAVASMIAISREIGLVGISIDQRAKRAGDLYSEYLRRAQREHKAGKE